jgi:phage terminase large subunit
MNATRNDIGREDVDISEFLNPNQEEVITSEEFELWVYGGGGAGKTSTICDKIILNAIEPTFPEQKALIIRKTYRALTTNTIPKLKDRCKVLGVPFHLNNNTMDGRIGKMTIHFRSLNDQNAYEGIQGITDLDLVYINELPEISEHDYSIIKKSVRGGSGKVPKQIICDFNPTGSYWVRNYGWNMPGISENVVKLHYTVLDNHPSFVNSEEGKRYIKVLQDLQYQDINLYKIYFLGEWGELTGVIYNWPTVPMSSIVGAEEFWYGLDFGFSVSKNSLTRIWRKGIDLFLQNIIYTTDYDTPMLSYVMRNKYGIGSEPIYCDSARPDSIETLSRDGFNVRGVDKGPGSVLEGINFMKGVPIMIDGKPYNPPYRVHILEDSPEIETERRSYVWRKDKDGRPVDPPAPVKFQDDTMDSSRYGVTGHLMNPTHSFISLGGKTVIV